MKITVQIISTWIWLAVIHAGMATADPGLKPWLRLADPVENVQMNRLGKGMAFTSDKGKALKYLNLKTLKVHLITPHQVDNSFFWAPDGVRIIYREHVADSKVLIKSRLRAYDIVLGKSVDISEFPEPTGILTFDPRDLRFMMLTKNGIHSNRLKFPDKREARWQMAARQVDGKYVVAQNAILWITDGGLTMNRLEDDRTGTQSFDISPDGLTIVWATKGERVYISEAGSKPKFIDYGLDPKWHPVRRQIIMAGARKIGSKTHNYDLKISDTKGVSRFLTSTQTHDERWPVFSSDVGRLYFTRTQTTDLYEMDLM